MEAWGGAEYTCNRVGDRYIDQMELSGHMARDLELFSELGIHALRCGLLWERHDLDPSWQWADAYLSAFDQSGMRPILGLVHHGSGPKHTSLLDPEFAPKLAHYAGEVAARYPWVRAYTPVNEPHTTARFACRYGLWYPHHCSRESYLRALLHQMKATVLSMRAIRNVRSDAQLVQTEDMGFVWSTPELSATAALFSERRWLAYDLLCGTVDRLHPLYDYVLRAGISDEEIFWFADNPCPPDILGVNYYVTSDRFLDHRVNRYPARYRSAEGRFVDLEAVRVRPEGIQGFETVLLEAHERYGLPLAITEVHLGDRVEEQIRWAAEAWNGAARARDAAVSCRAVTFWALLGSYFWNELVTVENGHYEPGVFELLRSKPHPTALAELVRQCARGETVRHPALAEAGWWRQPGRIQYDIDAELVA
jgi:dTDP-4-dehydrorhamnose reductase